MRATTNILRNASHWTESVQYFTAGGAVAVVSVLSHMIFDRSEYQTVALVLLLSVAVLSLSLKVGPVLLAAGVSALIWNFFFIQPYFTFAIGQSHDVLMFFAYFIIAAVTGVLTTRIREREHHAVAVYGLSKELIAADSIDAVSRTAVKQITEYFGAEVVLFVRSADGELDVAPHSASTVLPGEKESAVATWVFRNGKKAGRHIDRLPFAECTYYPVSGPRSPLGVVGIRTRDNSPLDPGQERILEHFFQQIASAWEREQLNELTKHSAAAIESERLYRTLFHSLSHELRTPIAAIITAAEILGANTPDEIVNEIRTAAERLNRLVENLLDMTRLESGQLAPNLDWCDLRDIINTSVKKLREELSGYIVRIGMAEDLPLIKLDFGLMEQALTNLLHNATLYTPAGTTIDITARMSERELTLIIQDNGPGFPDAALKKLFEKFYRVPGTKTGGTGLGLSIAKGFIEAHKGSITADNRSQGGAQFEITIPIIF